MSINIILRHGFFVHRNYFFNGGLERSLIRQMRIEKAKSLKETYKRYVILYRARRGKLKFYPYYSYKKGRLQSL